MTARTLTYTMAFCFALLMFALTAGLSSYSETLDKIRAFEDKLIEYETMYCSEKNSVKRGLIIALIRKQIPDWQPICHETNTR